MTAKNHPMIREPVLRCTPIGRKIGNGGGWGGEHDFWHDVRLVLGPRKLYRGKAWRGGR